MTTKAPHARLDVLLRSSQSTLAKARRLTPRWVGRLSHIALENAGLGRADISASRAARAEFQEQLEHGTKPGSLVRLSAQECAEVLRAQHVGRLAFNARVGQPDLAVVNYVMDGQDVLISSGPGPKLEAARRHEKVAFEVDELDEERHAARSVVLTGVAELLDPHTQVAELPDRWAAGPRRRLVRIRTGHVEGRRLVGTDSS